MKTTLLTDLELSCVLDALDTLIIKLAEKLSGRLAVGESDQLPPEEYRNRLIVLRRAREKIMMGGL